MNGGRTRGRERTAALLSYERRVRRNRQTLGTTFDSRGGNLIAGVRDITSVSSWPGRIYDESYIVDNENHSIFRLPFLIP